MPTEVIAYVASWCPDCTRSKRVLSRLGVVYSEIDIDTVVGASEAMRMANGGSGKIPTIIVDGRVLIEPTDRELESALSRR